MFQIYLILVIPQMAKSLKPFVEFLLEQLESGECYGVEWVNNEERMFQLPWKRVPLDDEDKIEWCKKEGSIFLKWAKLKGTFKENDTDYSKYKQNFRNILNKFKDDFVEIEEKHGTYREQLMYKVYQFKDESIFKKSKRCMPYSKDESSHSFSKLLKLDQSCSLNSIQPERAVHTPQQQQFSVTMYVPNQNNIVGQEETQQASTDQMIYHQEMSQQNVFPPHQYEQKIPQYNYFPTHQHEQEVPQQNIFPTHQQEQKIPQCNYFLTHIQEHGISQQNIIPTHQHKQEIPQQNIFPTHQHKQEIPQQNIFQTDQQGQEIPQQNIFQTDQQGQELPQDFQQMFYC